METKLTVGEEGGNMEKKKVTPKGRGIEFKVVSAPMKDIEHKLNLLTKTHEVEVVGTSVVGNHLVVLCEVRKK